MASQLCQPKMSPRHAISRHPLPFNCWFARRAYKTDLLFLVVELIASNTPYLVRLISDAVCLPVGGYAHATALLDLQPVLDPAARRVDAVIVGFPCGATYISQLLYVLRSGAVLDPWLRLRLYDFANLGHLLTQLLTLIIAVLAPSVYLRWRNCLFIAISLISLLGVNLSAVFSPSSLLPLGAAANLSIRRERMAAAYFTWKTATVLQLPSSLQLISGPMMWLLFLGAMFAVDRRMAAMGYAVQQPQLGAGQAVLLFFVIAVLPYLVVECCERAWLLPQYDAYLRSWLPVGSGCGGGGNRGGNGGGNGSGSSDVKKADTSQPAAASAAAPVTRAAPANKQHDRHVTLTLPQPTPRTVLYRSAHGVGRTYIFSIKTSLPAGSDFSSVATRVKAAAIEALRRTDVDRRRIGYEHKQQSNGQPSRKIDGTTSGNRASNAVEGLRPLSLVCVEGCLQLLIMLHSIGGGGTRAAWQGSPAAGPRECTGDGDGRSNHFNVRHVRRDASEPAPEEVAATPVVPPPTDIAVTACMSALGILLAEMDEGGGYGAGVRAPGSGDAGGDGLSAVTAIGGGDDLDAAAGALLWPPVVSRQGTSEIVEPSASATSTGGDGRLVSSLASIPTAGRVTQQRHEQVGVESSHGGGNGDDDSALVLLPARALHGRTSVRCVVAGPVGQCSRQEVHLDRDLTVEATLAGAGNLAIGRCDNNDVDGVVAEEDDGDGGGHGDYAILRIRMPPTALATSGVFIVYLLAPGPVIAPGPPDRQTEVHEPESEAPFCGGSRSYLATAGDASTSASASAASMAGAPLATLPLLVLPNDAAEEMRQLHSRAFGDDNATANALNRLLTLGADAGAGDVTAATSLGGTGTSLALQAAVAATTQHQSGLLSLACDMGFMIAAAEGSAHTTQRQDAAWTQRPPQLPDPRVVDSVIGFLELQGMAACLREIRDVMAPADMVEAISITKLGGVVPVNAAARMAAPQHFGCQVIEAPSDSTFSMISSTKSGCPENQRTAMDSPSLHEHTSGGALLCSGGGVGGGSSASICTSGGCQGVGRYLAPSLPEPLPPSRSPLDTPDAYSSGLTEGSGRAAGGWWWMLRNLVLGFPNPNEERAYQSFKAMKCGHLDQMALVVLLPLRISTALRTYCALADALRGNDVGSAAVVCESCVCGSYSGTGDVCVPGPDTLLSDFWCDKPLVTQLQLQMLLQAIHLTSSVVPLTLALFTTFHARHRNALLLLRAFLDYGTLAFILLPLPWRDSLLPVPAVWLEACKRHSVIVLYRSIWEPLTLQLSPHLAIWPILVSVAPLTLLMRRCYFGRWHPALSFVAWTALSQLAMYSATDLRTRRGFLTTRLQLGPGAAEGGDGGGIGRGTTGLGRREGEMGWKKGREEGEEAEEGHGNGQWGR